MLNPQTSGRIIYTSIDQTTIGIPAEQCMITFKGSHTPKHIILLCVRWYCSYSLSYRNIEKMMTERRLRIDHSTLNRWVVHCAPKLEKAFHKKKKRPGNRWRMDETYLKVRGQWRYYYRAVDKKGNTIDFLLTAKRETKAALRFLNKAIDRNGKPLPFANSYRLITTQFSTVFFL